MCHFKVVFDREDKEDLMSRNLFRRSSLRDIFYLSFGHDSQTYFNQRRKNKKNNYYKYI